MKLTNFYSNIWILSNFNNNDIEQEKIIKYIANIKNNNNIDKNINFDKEFNFWKNNNGFNNTINTQIIIDNQKKVITLYKKISKIILNSFINQKHILLISYKNNECLLGFIIYFLCNYANITLDNAVNVINSKLGTLHNYSIDVNIQKILIQTCYKKI
jgi:hypothetical protein